MPRARSRAALAAAAIAIASAPAGGQTTAPQPAGARLSPPAACTKAASDYRSAKVTPAYDAYRKATDSLRPIRAREYSAVSRAAYEESRAMATACAARFSVTTIPADQLFDLITLYQSISDTAGARQATDRLLAEKSLPDRARGQALQLAMSREASRDPNWFGIIPAAENYARQIDGLPDSLDDIKLQAHRVMLGRYEYLDVAEGLYHHARAVIDLGRTLHQPPAMISGYLSLARSYADRLHPDSALKVLDAGEKEIGATATQAFADFRDRYALIGTRAQPIEATWWINPDSSHYVAPAPGKVTLIEFTAHWCGPCKNSYPGLRQLAERLKGEPFAGFMVTQLYGYLGTRQNLSPEEEVAADREYFGPEHQVPFPVAINPQSKPVPGQPYPRPKPDADYRVGGIPQIMIIDKQGIIRQIVTGWDQGNTDRFQALIERLIREPG